MGCQHRPQATMRLARSCRGQVLCCKYRGLWGFTVFLHFSSNSALPLLLSLTINTDPLPTPTQAINHYTSLNLTKLDVLDTFPTLKVAVAYKDPATGEELDFFPADLSLLERCEVVYKEFEGWNTPTTHIKKFEELPAQARQYVEFIEQYVGVKAGWIGTGPDREDMIYR